MLRTQAKRQPKEPKGPKKKSKEIVLSLETTEYVDDQKPLNPEPSILDVNTEAIAPKAKARSRAKAKAKSIAEPVAEPGVEPITVEAV